MRCFGWLMAVVLLGGCGAAGDAGVGSAASIETEVESIGLPAPSAVGELTLEEALAGRRSIREFTVRPLTDQELSQLLWAAQGITSTSGKRAAPSAGALYPLELYVVTAVGHYRYVPEEHSLVALGAEDLRERLAEAAVGQEVVAEAAAVVVITAVYARTEERYGDRSVRYATLEAGHAAQNVLLQATTLGLGAVPVGAFVDVDVRDLLDLPIDHEPLYLIPIGEPA